MHPILFFAGVCLGNAVSAIVFGHSDKTYLITTIIGAVVSVLFAIRGVQMSIEKLSKKD
jgi:predicted secreted protein